MLLNIYRALKKDPKDYFDLVDDYNTLHYLKRLSDSAATNQIRMGLERSYHLQIIAMAVNDEDQFTELLRTTFEMTLKYILEGKNQINEG